MSNSDRDQHDSGETGRVQRRDFPLRACFQRHRMLDSVWSTLTLFGLADGREHMVAMAQGVCDELQALSCIEPDARDEASLPKIHSRLDSFESEMRTAARAISIEELRAQLPARLLEDRRGLLDLLDVMLASELDGPGGVAGSISPLEYLISLLCADAAEDGSPIDPLSLTPRLYGLCERAGDLHDTRIPEIEADLLAAAEDLKTGKRSAVDISALHHRIQGLGELFFVPQVLRAIVAYNKALLVPTSDQAMGFEMAGSPTDASEIGGGRVSVFEASALPALAEALSRRQAEMPQELNAIDRVAWCLDLSFPNAAERKSLLGRDVGRREDLRGTVILVGLLSRSAVVLSEELAPINISAERLADEWVPELDAALRQESDQLIASDRYDEACALSELRLKFLFSPMGEVHRENRKPPSANSDTKWEAEQFRSEAKELATKAVDSKSEPVAPVVKDDAGKLGISRIWRSWPRATQWRVGLFLASGVLFALLIVNAVRPSGDLVGLDRDTLESVSPYLERGKQSGEGTGPSFVGRINDAWSELGPTAMQQAADQLVEGLRLRGIRDIMIYDRGQRLRIQALGQQPIRVLGTESP